MAMTSTERQRAYRQRKFDQGTDARLDLVISATAAAALKRLARHQGLSQRAMLERLLADAEGATVAALTDTAAYFDVTR